MTVSVPPLILARGTIHTGTPLGSQPSTSLLLYSRLGSPSASESSPCFSDLDDLFDFSFWNFSRFSSTVLLTYSKYGGFPGLTTVPYPDIYHQHLFTRMVRYRSVSPTHHCPQQAPNQPQSVRAPHSASSQVYTTSSHDPRT